MNAFRGTLGIRVIQCRPGDPEAKGLVERANQRRHRRLGCRPVDRWAADRTAMLALPPVAPVTGWRSSSRLPRDHYLRLDSNDYSVHPSAVGRRVQLAAGLDEVVVTCGGTEVARHARCWADHQSITDQVHAAAAAEMRQARRLVPVPKVDTNVEHRALTDYDRLLGLDGTEEGIA